MEPSPACEGVVAEVVVDGALVVYVLLLFVAIVLAIMILPIITSQCREIFIQTPRLHEEAALALGSTKWDMIKATVFSFARNGIVSAVMLGLGRALGETMAVTFVIGNANRLSASLFAPGNSIASTLANEFAEADPTLHIPALYSLGLILFVITFVVLAIAKVLTNRVARKAGT